jgi:hypothetical protein
MHLAIITVILIIITTVLSQGGPNDILQFTSYLTPGADPCNVMVQETFTLKSAIAWSQVKRQIPQRISTSNPSTSITNVVCISLNTSLLQVTSTAVTQQDTNNEIIVNVKGIADLPVTITLTYYIQGSMGVVANADTIMWTILTPYYIANTTVQVYFPPSWIITDANKINVTPNQGKITKQASTVIIEKPDALLPNTAYDVTITLPQQLAKCKFLSTAAVGLSRGAIIGIAVGGAVSACLVCGCFVCTILLCACGYARRKREKASTDYDYTAIPTGEKKRLSYGSCGECWASIGLLLGSCCAGIANLCGNIRFL